VARVLIVYANPAVTASPVPPLGAQRIRAILAGAGCEARLISPWLALDPAAELDRALDWEPDLVGLSVRNVDDSLVVRSEVGEGAIETRYYLPEVEALVSRVRGRGVPLLAGGTAVSSAPMGVLTALGVRWGIIGPAEDLCWRLGRALATGVPFPEALPDDARVVDRLVGEPDLAALREASERWRSPPGPTPRSSAWLALAREREGRVPVFFSAGCNRRCAFCVEAGFLGGRVVPRPVEDTLDEIEGLHRAAGVRRFFLAGSELNVPDARALTRLMLGLADRRLDVDVRGFLQPAPVDDALLDAMEAAGHDPSDFSFEFGHFDDRMLRRGAGPASRRQLQRLVELWVRRGYRTLGGSALLGGHPEETWGSIERALLTIREFDDALPDGLGLAWSPGARVYPASPLGRWVRDHPGEAAPDLYGRVTPDLIEPVVFCRPAAPRELFARVQEGLAGCKGLIRPMNDELRAAPEWIEAERRVNTAIVARDGGLADEARGLLSDALGHDPDHTEALRQLALVLANDLDQADEAREVLHRLRRVVLGHAERTAEVDAALAALGGTGRSMLDR
jgi:hypothetical protein